MSRNMKDSGIEWIGEIPENWRVIKYKGLLKKSRNAMRVGPFGSHLKGEDFIDEGINVYNQRTVIDDNFHEGESFISEKKYTELIAFKVEPGDILITTRGTIGRIALVPEDVKPGIIHPCIIKSSIETSQIDYRYLKYIFNNTNITLEQFVLSSNATTIPVIYSEPLRNIYLPYCSKEVQERICNYLDSRCTLIDKTIEKQKQVIEKLKEYKQSVITEAVTKGLNPSVPMKNSGIEWIGEIPEHWNTKIGKYLLKKENREVKENYEVITCFRDGEVTLRKYRREEGFTFADKEIGYQGIIAGDLVIHGMDGFAGAIGISDSDGKGSPVLNVCTSYGELDVNFARYYLRMLASQNVFIALATGIRERSCDLRWNKIASLPFVLPKLDEQKKICCYLEKVGLDVSLLVNKKEQYIFKLESYKKSLIYECVTGKREVK